MICQAAGISSASNGTRTQTCDVCHLGACVPAGGRPELAPDEAVFARLRSSHWSPHHLDTRSSHWLRALHARPPWRRPGGARRDDADPGQCSSS